MKNKLKLETGSGKKLKKNQLVVRTLSLSEGTVDEVLTFTKDGKWTKS